MIKQIIRPSTPLYDTPDRQSPLETECLFGESFTVLENTEGWCYGVLATDGYHGWVAASALGVLPEPTHRVVTPRALLTQGRDIKTPAVSAPAWLPLAALVCAVPAKPNLMAIEGNEGRLGFTPAHHLTPLNTPVDDWVSIAESLIGTPYRWGGRDSIGIDCSALLQLALATAGIKAKRNSGEQEKTLGDTLPPNTKLQRGDIIFWPGHVGVMRDGTTLLHANAYHGAVASEPLAQAQKRLEIMGLPITRIARL